MAKKKKDNILKNSEVQLLIRVGILLLSVAVIASLISFLMEAIPEPQGTVDNMTYKEYSNILALLEKYSRYLYHDRYVQYIQFYHGACLAELGKLEKAIPLLKKSLKGKSDWWEKQSVKYLDKYQ